jgi:hypothetical protein
MEALKMFEPQMLIGYKRQHLEIALLRRSYSSLGKRK